MANAWQPQNHMVSLWRPVNG